MLLFKFILIHYAIMIILYKYNLKGIVTKVSKWLSVRRGGRSIGWVLYELGECVFCLHYWGGFLILPFLFWVCGVQSEFWIFPLMSTGAIFITGKEMTR